MVAVPVYWPWEDWLPFGIDNPVGLWQVWASCYPHDDSVIDDEAAFNDAPWGDEFSVFYDKVNGHDLTWTERVQRL